MKLGETILKKRQERGLSQEKLAELIGVSRQAVSKWEVGDAIPDTDKLIPLAKALGITVDELLGNAPEEEEIQEDVSNPPVSGEYMYAQVQPGPERKPGWFATHWYWLGLVPVVWGGWQLLKILGVLLILVLNMTGTGGAELTVGAEEIVVESSAALLE